MVLYQLDYTLDCKVNHENLGLRFPTKSGLIVQIRLQVPFHFVFTDEPQA